MRWLTVGRSALCVLGLAACARASQTPPTPVPGSVAALKLTVTTPGLYQVRLSDLRAAGLAVEGPLRLTYHGETRPVWVADNTATFYAASHPSAYTPDDVYWLEPAVDAAPMALLTPPTLSTVTADYTATRTLEENRLYYPQVQGGDHWLWQPLPAKQALTYTLALEALAPGPGVVQVNVWSNTSGPGERDHHLQVTLNGQPLGAEFWDGAGVYTLTLPLAAEVLKNGENTLVVTAVGDTGLAADIVFIDRVRVFYPRTLAAVEGQLQFVSLGGTQTVSGFGAEPAVFDVTDPAAPARVSSTYAKGAATFETEAHHTYAVVAPTAYAQPQLAPAALTPAWRAEKGAAYVAIGPADLLAAAQPLLDYHTAQGLSALAIPIETLYDQFNFGRAEPEAIRAFLQFATQQWATPPRYVLLVGDTTYDTYGYLTPRTANRLPSPFVHTHYGGQTVSDVVLTQLDADAAPDIALGRVPANTPEQVRVWVQKTLDYAKNPPAGAWRAQVLAVADGQEAQFAAEGQRFLDLFAAAPYSTTLLAPPANTATTEVLNAWNSGQGLIAYFGHGSLTQWGKDNLLTTKETGALTNGGRLPLVLNLTCLTGFFAHPKIESLTESWLWQPNGGAVAVLAPTSLTLPTDQSFLTESLIRAYLADPTMPVGDMVLAAQQSLATQPNAREVLLTFWLFGDPALRVVGP